MDRDVIKKKNKSKIRNKFVFYFIVLSCVPVLLLGVISLYALSVSHQQSVYDLEYQVLQEKTKVIKNFFEELTSTLSIKVETLDIKTVSETKKSWQETFAEALIEDNPALIEVSFADLQGKEIAKKSRKDKSPDLLYVSKLSQFNEALGGKTSISSVHTTMNGQSVSLAVPVWVEGKIYNVVLAEVDITSLSKSINGIVLGDTGYVFMVDNLGSLIGTKKEGYFNPGYNLSGWEKINDMLSGKLQGDQEFGKRYKSLLADKPVIGSVSKIPELNWVVLVEWPVEDADSLLADVREKILITVFLGIVIASLAALYLSSKLVRPIKLLERTSKDIELGNFEKKVEIITGDELQELGESFNRMSNGLKRLQELKNEFVFIAAHELRAPVSAIKGYLSMIFEGDAGSIPENMKGFLNPIKQSNDRLGSLVNDLLNIARSEAGRLEIAVSSCDIVSPVKSILQEVESLAKEKNITINYEPQVDIPKVMIDEGRFKEVIMNLVSNAIKYGNNGGWVKITHELNNEFVITKISDNGLGISEEGRKHLFEKFFRADEVKKTSIQGTGLGLFITKELVEKMGGNIKVESELGKGTTFVISFKRG